MLLLKSFQCRFFGSEKPDAVFLQEVLPQTLELIQTCLPDYQSYAGKIEIFIECLNTTSYL
jgi:hypothetical protein